ncbi:transposase [Xenorhabdus nematophila AN6/1]|nr:transposase [Xenorhabdus nematophila AN6/1]
MHNTTRDSRVCDRIKAGLLAHEGWTAQRIARALRIHDSTVSRHLKDFLAQEKLPPENGGSESHLSAEHPADLIDYLTANLMHTPAQIGASVFPRRGNDERASPSGFQLQKAKRRSSYIRGG